MPPEDVEPDPAARSPEAVAAPQLPHGSVHHVAGVLAERVEEPGQLL